MIGPGLVRSSLNSVLLAPTKCWAWLPAPGLCRANEAGSPSWRNSGTCGPDTRFSLSKRARRLREEAGSRRPMGWWRGAERRCEGPARDLLSPSARPAGSLARAAMRKWALRAQTLSSGPGLRHLSAQSGAGLPPGRSKPDSLCQADQVFWASLGESPTGRGPQRRWSERMPGSAGEGAEAAPSAGLGNTHTHTHTYSQLALRWVCRGGV